MAAWLAVRLQIIVNHLPRLKQAVAVGMVIDTISWTATAATVIVETPLVMLPECSVRAVVQKNILPTSPTRRRRGNGPLTDALKIIDGLCSRTRQKLRDFVRDAEKLIGAIKRIANPSARLAREEHQPFWKSSYGFPYLPFRWCKARFSPERDAE